MSFAYRTWQGSRGRLRYLDFGTGPALVFLHGAGVRATSYSGILKRLSLTRRVIAPDLPGFGGSFTPPADWTAREYAEEIARLVAALGVTTYEVAGHSFGGALALELAAGNAAATRLVLIDPLAVPPPCGMLALLARFSCLKTLVDLAHPRRWVRCLRLALTVAANSLKRGLRSFRITRIVIREVYRKGRPFARISQPVTLAWGSRDEIFPVESAQSMAGLIAHARVIHVPGNHDWCLFEDGAAADLFGSGV